MDSSGKEISNKSVSNKPETLAHYFAHIPAPFDLALETTYNWYFFVDLAEQYASNVYLANALALKAFAKYHKKTDAIDANLIASVLRKGYLPTVTIPDQKTRHMRELLRYRMHLVRDRARTIVRLKSLLDKLGESSAGNFTTITRVSAIPTEHLPPLYQAVIKGYVKTISSLNVQISQANSAIKEEAVKDEDTLRLITIPGLDYYSALLVKSELIDINRFATFERLAAYVGLVPRTLRSADTVYHGSLNKNSRGYVRWILIETVLHFIRADAERTRAYADMVKRKGARTARIAFARKMLKVVYHVLKERRDYYA